MLKILELEESHFAFRSIKNLIEKPSSEGTQLLHFAAVEFKNFLFAKFKQNWALPQQDRFSDIEKRKV